MTSDLLFNCNFIISIPKMLYKSLQPLFNLQIHKSSCNFFLLLSGNSI